MRHVLAKKRWGFLAMLLITVLVISGCGNQQAGKSSGSKGDAVKLTVSAAASLTDALQEIQKNYESQTSGVQLHFNFGGSGALQQQIEQGAPVDLFLSAASKNMQVLVDKQLVASNQQNNFLANELTVITASETSVSVQEAKDLLKTGIQKIAIGIPETVPAGKYAQEALSNAGVWDDAQSKLVQAKDVRQVLQYVQTGNADAGFVYKTDALTAKDKVKIAYTVDPKLYTPITYPIGIVQATNHAEEAKQLYDYLQSKEAMDVFVKYGFSVPDSK
ncbi:molybdate ABC transporter substrate-binding protein [Paenibacillus sp. ACRRX]|uniref:molybdate ABC transporter substrate-binding protein n=1 Tax=Paenibacillus sp. ACRRX TaxID=2918206 RepID=UPI001EF5BEF0|nr:molybdate ABC transporter substrate-binding protein [Paenibacillus sp. ACRRX]MCG7406981.1 molybdate ABC transporter substrate-binding protein [Paenibacillus sp. ACRRX]